MRMPLAAMDESEGTCLPEEPQDSVLVRRILEGEDVAFTQLMRRHKKWLYRFISRYVGHGDDAFDLLQETFVAAWAALERYDADRPFQAWLRQIALNKCRDWSRRTAVRSIVQRATSELAHLASRARWANPEAMIETGDALQRLDAAIASLPIHLREPLVLTVLENLSHRETAQLLGISEKAVETRVYRAKRQLSRLIGRPDLQTLTEDDEP